MPPTWDNSVWRARTVAGAGICHKKQMLELLTELRGLQRIHTYSDPEQLLERRRYIAWMDCHALVTPQHASRLYAHLYDLDREGLWRLCGNVICEFVEGSQPAKWTDPPKIRGVEYAYPGKGTFYRDIP